ncbi:MAG: type II toxin-antitoxin system Phd/YefM family antitoxin [Lentisphaerae bacterium]|nr:type II toxin-antitoxin system Phd/YefM family antitoxin [Lentisphaerota bacterium]
MKTTTIRHAKTNLIALLATVRHGETILITDHHAPVARLEPVGHATMKDSDHLIALEREGLLRRARKPLTKAWLKVARPRTKDGASIVKALLADREEAR